MLVRVAAGQHAKQCSAVKCLRQGTHKAYATLARHHRGTVDPAAENVHLPCNRLQAPHVLQGLGQRLGAGETSRLILLRQLLRVQDTVCLVLKAPVCSCDVS